MTENEGSEAEKSFEKPLRLELTTREINEFLVELTKERAIKLLETYVDKGLSDVTLVLSGTSITQVLVVRTWVDNFVVPKVLRALLKEKEEVAAKQEEEIADAGNEPG